MAGVVLIFWQGCAVSAEFWTNSPEGIRRQGGIWSLDVKFLFHSFLDPNISLGTRTKRHDLPADFLNENFPDVRQAKPQVLGGSNSENSARRSDRGDAFVLLDDDTDVLGTDVHGASRSEINDAVFPLLDFLRMGQKTKSGLEKIINRQRTAAVVDDAKTVLASLDFNGHKSKFDAGCRPIV